MTRVTFDDQIFTSQRRGGVSRYFAELMNQFRTCQDHRIDASLMGRWAKSTHAHSCGLARPFPVAGLNRTRILRAANRISLPKKASRIVHHTMYDGAYLTRFDSVDLRVITIYDMIPELFPHHFPKGNPHLDKLVFIQRADLILCISETTRSDLIEICGRPSASVHVTPLAVSRAFQPGQPPVPGTPDRYVLHVGRRRGYKNFDVLLNAFATADLGGDVHLLQVGGPPFDHGESELIDQLGLTKRVHHRDLPDSQMPSVYANALCLVFPSKYEGFGLPTLEAMAAGCPAILADTSAHPEIGGSAAAYFAPQDAPELAGLLTRIVNDADERTRMIEAGFENVQRFSWFATAAATASAYREALS